MRARLSELARALQKEIRSTSEDGFTAEQNGEIADMETTLQKFIETVEGRAPMTDPGAVEGVLASIQSNIREADALLAEYTAARAGKGRRA